MLSKNWNLTRYNPSGVPKGHISTVSPHYARERSLKGGWINKRHDVISRYYCVIKGKEWSNFRGFIVRGLSWKSLSRGVNISN